MLPSHRRNNINSSSRSPKVDRLGSEVTCRCRQSSTVGSLRGTCVAPPTTSATHSRPASLQVHTECSRGPGHDMDSPLPLWRSFHESGSSRSSILPSSYKPDNREQLRKAASMLCKEMTCPPPHIRTRLVWAEIEKRMQSLVRLEQIWGTSNTVSSLNNLNLVNLGSARVGTTRSTLTGVSGEEGERRAFYEALRDGFVLCQLMNKLCPANAVRPDPREQGNKNVTRFLAACASHGLQNQNLFWADDLIDPTSESLARVAHTIITLIQLVETPTPSHIKPAADTHLDALLLSENSAASPMASLEMSNNDRMKSPTTIESTIARATVEERPVTATKEVTAAAMTLSMSSSLFQDVTALPGPYMKGSMGYASSVPPPPSTPSSPHSTMTSPMQKEHSPPVRLPSIYLDTPGEGESAAALTRLARLDTGRFAAVRVGDKRSFGMNRSRGDANEEDTTTLTGEEETTEEKQEEKGGRGAILEVRREKAISVPQIFKPPPPPPLVELLLRTQPPKRTRVQKNMNDGGISAWVRSAASPSPSTMSSRGSLLTPTTTPCTSANIAITTTSGDSATDTLSLSSSPSSTLLRSQLHRGRGREHTSAALSRVSSIAAESTRAPISNISFLRSSLPLGTSQSNEYHPLKLQHQRPSAGSTATSTNVTTRVSNNMQFGYSSSGGHGSVGRTEGEGERFGTIRSVAMDSTSDSIMNSAVVENDEMEDGHGSVISRLHLVPLPKTLTKDRERRSSVVLAQHSGHAVDLTRVAEGSNESPLSGDGIQEEERDGGVRKGCRKEEEEKTKERDGKGKGRSSSPRRVALHTAESPDNVSERFPMYSRSLTLSILDPKELSLSSIPARTSSFRASYDIAGSSSMSRSVSPHKLADVGGRIGNEPSSLASRRPAQFRYHNLDPSTRASSGTLSMSPGATSGLLPKASLDSGLGSPSSAGNPTTAKVMVVRRTSANKDSLPALGLPHHHTGSSLSIRMRNNQDATGTPGSNASGRSGNEGMVCGETIGDLSGRLCGDLMVREDKKGNGSRVGAGWRATPVPFPRLVTGDNPATPLSPGNTSTSTNASNNSANNKQLRPPRRRFQSELGSGCTTRSRPRPNSCDELGTRPSRMRFESMVSLGRANSAIASTNDLVARNSMYGNAVKQMLTVKEKGKPSTHFQLGNCIGKGQFGSVYRALNLSTGQMVAVKRIRLEGLKEDEISTLMKEVDLVKSLSHPGIVKCEGMVRDEDTLSIVLEYVENGSLAHTLKAFGKFNEKLVASYVTKILEGLHYLHQSEVVHCDLKAANILTTKNGNVKLSDFGVSLNLRAMERQTQNDIAGTPNWMAPEVIELKGTSTKSDIWSLGCTVIELFTGRPPYADISNSMAEDNGPPIPERCSEMLQDFLKQCFHKDPSQRPSAEVLCEHPWLKNNWDALQNLRPQDSIPFLRRVSVDMQKSDMVQHLARVDLIDSPTGSESLCSGDAPGSPPLLSPVGRRTSNTSIGPAAIDPEHTSGDHNFVKTTFGKSVICRVCLENVKKAAVLCAKCSLISHSKCASNAPPTCDLRSQLLLYAHYAEQGSPHGLRVNPPLECSEIPRASFAISDAPCPTHHTPRTSLDTLASQPSRQLSPSHPISSTAFKLKTVFKRSWSSLTNDSNVTSSPDPPKGIVSVDRPSDLHFDERTPVPRKRPTGMLQKRLKERPRSYISNSTGLGGLRSAATTTESLNSSGATEARRLSQLSSTAIAGASPSQECDGTVIPKEQVKSRQNSISVKVPAVSKSAATPGHETTNDLAELNMSSSIVPGPSSRDPFLRKRNSKNSSDHGNCIIQ